MSDLKISQLPAASSVAGTEASPLVQAGETRKAALSVIKTYMSAGLVSAADLISTANNKGAGLSGYSDTATYPADTVGEKLQSMLSGINTIYTIATKYMTSAQLAGVHGTGDLVDVTDALDLAIADVGDVSWRGSVAAERPSAGGMKAGGVVLFPPGTYMISRTLYRPAHVTFVGQSGGGFFEARPNDGSTANGNVANVKQALILANFPAGSGAGQAGQMWVIDTANWTSAGARAGYKTTYTGNDFDVGNISAVPGGGELGIVIDSVRDPATGFHIANQIPYGGIRCLVGLNSVHDRIGISGVDFGLLVNASWGYSVTNVFGQTFLNGYTEIADVNAGWSANVYFARDTTLDSTAPRSISASNRFSGIGSLTADANGLPEDFTNMRYGRFIQNPNGIASGTTTFEGWDINVGIFQSPYAGVDLGTTYSEGAIIAPLAAVAFIGTIASFFDNSAVSRYGYCWGLNCSFSASGLLPRRLATRPLVEDPNRNININVGKPDLYLNVAGGLSSNMLSWSNDVTQGVTLANMTSARYSYSAVDQSFTAGILTASGAGVASLTKSGANVAPITGTVIGGVDYTSHVYCHWADFRAGTAPTTAIELAFSGGSASTVKAVIAWSGGVPTLTLSGTSPTGFAQSLGQGWYRINIAGPSGNNTAMTAKIYIGDGTTTAAAGQTVYIGEHEVNPTLFPLAPIYNQSASVPKIGIQGEHWEWYPGIHYNGMFEGKIRVAASGVPTALGYETGNQNTGTWTTLDSALYRISLSDRDTWEIIVKDGDSVVVTANNTSLAQKSKTLHFDSYSSDGHTWTLSCIATPSGTASYIPAEGICAFSFENAAINMPSSTTSDATLCGLILLQTGSVSNSLVFGLRNTTATLGDSWCLIQQGAESSHQLFTLFRNSTITGTSTASIHAQSANPTKSKTKVSQTSTDLTLGGVINSTIANANGYANCVGIATSIA